MGEPLGPVLVASDLQARFRPVIPFAAGIARAADTDLFLLHVIEPGSIEHPLEHRREDLIERRRRNCARALEVEADELERAGTRVTTGLVVNRPAHEAILERIRYTGASLVVVGSAARQGRGHLLGSTADRLLRSSPVPCLIVRGRPELPVRRAAAATDFSDPSRVAIRRAIPWVEQLGEGDTQLALLHAARGPDREPDSAAVRALEERLEGEVERFQGASGALRLSTRLCFGEHPVETLVAAAEEEAVQLLVAGTHGHGRVRRALIGSVAMGLAQSAPCPVLIVPHRSAG